MPHAEANGQRLYYEDTGGNGPAVIFSHGFLMDHAMFDPQDPLAQAVSSIIFGGGYDPAPWITKWQATEKEAIRQPFATLIGRDDITDRLGEIAAPAIIFHGDEDAAIPMDKAETLAAGLTNTVELVRIVGAGHASNLSHPDAVNGPLLDFMRKYG